MNLNPQQVNSGVALTALASAAGRAVESSRPDRLIDDPLAAAFVAAATSPVPLPVRWPAPNTVLSDQEILLLHGAGYVGLRSRFCDDYLLRACAAGVGQVVVLAAGLDSRAFRLDWPTGVRLFELDQPGVLAFKDGVLHEQGALPRCARTVVGIDLRDDWAAALRVAGFDADVPTVWLAEGLLQYLPADAEQALFEYIDALSCAGSHLVIERTANLASLASAADGQRLRELSERTGIAMAQLVDTQKRDDPAGWLADRGWTVTSQPVATIAERYHRNLADQGLPRPSALPTAVSSAVSSASQPATPQTSTTFCCAQR